MRSWGLRGEMEKVRSRLGMLNRRSLGREYLVKGRGVLRNSDNDYIAKKRGALLKPSLKSPLVNEGCGVEKFSSSDIHPFSPVESFQLGFWHVERKHSGVSKLPTTEKIGSFIVHQREL